MKTAGGGKCVARLVVANAARSKLESLCSQRSNIAQSQRPPITAINHSEAAGRAPLIMPSLPTLYRGWEPLNGFPGVLRCPCVPAAVRSLLHGVEASTSSFRPRP